MTQIIFSRIAIVLRELWLILGFTLLLFGVLEATARIGYTLRDKWNDEQQIHWLLASDIYRNQDWAAEYFQEQNETLWITQSDWHSYIYWRHALHRGHYINIGQNGSRYTWNKTNSPSATQAKVFVFGGSALWGTGARDEFTIPSLIAKKLNAQNQEVWVTNLGEEGYVSTQEVIALMLELQKGNVPDVAIFYDGANDVFSAYQQGIAGIPQNEFNRAAEFNQFNWRGGLLEKSGLYRLVQTLGGRKQRTARTDAENRALANGVADAYIANIRIVESIAQEFGFRVAFYRQPAIYNKRNLSGWEQQQLDTYGEARFFAEADQVFKDKAIARTDSSFDDLRDAFGNESDTFFMDLFHISEAGNDRIAELIVKTLTPVIRSAP